MLLAGLGVGAMVHDRRSLGRSLLLGAGASLLWGIVVAFAASSLVVVLGGTALAVINVAVGALVGRALGYALRALRVSTQPSATSR
jgi:hypothetical protein